MPAWFYDLPIYLALVLIFATCNSISLIGYWFYKKYLIAVDNKDIITKVVWQTVLFFSTIFITFWIVTNWGNLGSLKQTTEREANSIAILYNDLSTLPTAPRVQLESNLNSYLQSVVTDEYVSLAEGQQSAKTNFIYRNLVLSIYNYQPTARLTDELRYNRILQHLSDLSDYRQDRLNYLAGSLSGALLTFFLTMIVVGCFWTGFVDTRSFSFTLFIIMSQNLILGSSSWLILEMDKPFQGQFSVTNAPFITIQKEISLSKNYISNNQASATLTK